MTQALDVKLGDDSNLEKLLQVTVETTRKIIDCDRVFVYSASNLPNAVVLAESVDVQYVSILGTTVKDPFLQGEYLEMFCYGLPVVINDLETANIDRSELEDLERLGVKALAIAPISVGEKLLALLVAHQYAKSHSWDIEAVDFLIEKAQIASLTLSNLAKAGSDNSSKQIAGSDNSSKQIDNNEAQQRFSIMEREQNGNGHSSNGLGSIGLASIATQEDNDKLFSAVINNIVNEKGQENIFNTTVEEVRNLLSCDRVVVYSLDEDNYGIIVAESVASGYPRALGIMIDDPCFANNYIEQYSDGRVRAINDIYNKKVTPCYREQLESLAVKANLVAPIIKEGRAFALLIAHQCSEARVWQETEIDWVTKIASQVGVMLEYASVVEETPEHTESVVDDGGKWNEHFSEAIQYIRQSLNQEDILKASVKEVRRVLECDRVLVYSLNQDYRYSTVIAESVALGWTRALNKKIDDPCFEPTYRQKYLNGRVRAWNNIYETGMTKCYIEQLKSLEVKANLVAPIINEGKLFGLLVAHQCEDFRDWQQSEIRWVAQVATQVGFALDNAKLLADAQQLQHQLDNEVKLTKYFTDATRYIRESLHKEDILDVSVEEVQRVLNSDRVVVYSLNQDYRYGSVIAESVAPGWTRALNREINDPCFEPTYREKYLNGSVRAWNNIYESNLTKCYVEQLEELEVKANLVAPIINEGKLFGLLVVHQCNDFRTWQQYEIRWVAQIAMQVGFALDNAKLLANAQKLQHQLENESKWTQYFTDTIQYIRQSLKTEDILKASVKEARRVLDCDRVVVYSMNSDRYGMIIAESVAPGWTRTEGRVIKDPCFENKYLDRYRNGRVRAINNIYESGMKGCYIQQLEQLEVKANLVTPIINEGELFGLLVAHQCNDFRDWQQSEVRWLSQVATQVGFALDNAKLLEKLEESHQLDRLSYQQQNEHTETFKHRVVEILSENGDAYKTLSTEAMRQSETTLDVLHQIQKVTDSFSDIALNVQQVKFQEQQNDLAIQSTKESLNRAVKSISDIQRTVQNVVSGFENLSNSCQQISETIDAMKDVSRQIVQQSMNITRTLNRRQTEDSDRDSILDLSDNIFTLMQQLFEATAKVEPLFANLKAEVKEKTITLDLGSQQLISGVGEFQTVHQKLDRVVALSNKMNSPIENISHSLENQTQSSTHAKDSVQEVANIAERISAQSMSITKSFNQLAVLVQKL